MTFTDYLILALIIVVLVAAWRAERNHSNLMDLLNDQATMLGDMLQAILKKKE
jgi:hypothetical protein